MIRSAEPIGSLVADLERTVRGEVRFDRPSRILYSTDASIYQIEPIGVVIPRDREDIVRVISAANDYGLPVLPRGGGTSLAGQTVGHAIVMDLSKYMNGVLEVNADERWVRVQPGVVLDELNALLKPCGLLFPPDTATGNRATIGGVIGNNSCGARSIIYGKTIDYATELSVVLSNGEEAVFRPLGPEQVETKKGGDGLEGHIYREVGRICEANRSEIDRRYPKILRRVGGYNLDEFCRNGAWNLSKMIVGSEGTLATVTEARLALLQRPRMTALAVVQFHALSEAMSATVAIVEHRPSAVELIDKMILDLTKGSLEYSRRMTFVQGDPAAILIVEFYGESRAELEFTVDRMEADLRAKGFKGAFTRAFEDDEQANIWKVRKAGLGLLLGMKGDHKPVTFVEDTAVPVDRLPDYVRRFEELVKRHGTRAAFYSHASVGLLHIRPVLNLKADEDVEKMRSIAEEVRDLVLEYGGAMSGEHGDGLARSCWNEKVFGPQLYQAFKETKAAFDPRNLMNPGKIVDAPIMTENLRLGSSYSTQEVDTYFKFAAEGGIAGAVELCSGVGLCRKTLEGTMCPSYMVTREEEHSTRGRANLLRSFLSGRLPQSELASGLLFTALDLCLQCKGCKGECPSNVDMAKLKSEMLAQRRLRLGVPIRSRIFARVDLINRVGATLAPVSNWIAASSAFRRLLELVLGIDRRRIPPMFARVTLAEWFGRRRRSNRVATGQRHDPIRSAPRRAGGGNAVSRSESGALHCDPSWAPPPRQSARRQVVLYNDCYLNYNCPEVGIAAVRVLEAAGFEVLLPVFRCCGRPMISKGLLREARAHAIHNIDRLYSYAIHGIPIVGCEPSCILTFRDEYPDLAPGPKSGAVASMSFLIDEFLCRLSEDGELDLALSVPPKSFLFHGHCHQKAYTGTAPTINMLRRLTGSTVEEVDSGCCGMAGSFGYEKEHYELSMEIGKRRLFQAIRARGDEVEVIASGVSCRQQISHGTGRVALHPIEALAAGLTDRTG